MTMSENWNDISQNLQLVRGSVVVLFCACLFGIIEYCMWGRTHWEEGALLLALLFLGAFDQLRRPMKSTPTKTCHIASWILLIVAGFVMLLSSHLSAEELGMGRTLCKNSAIFLLASALSLRIDGAKTTLSFFPLFLLAIVILPLYEYLLLEFSYPMRLVSTAASAFIARLFMVPVTFEDTTLFWNDQAITITDACSGISLLSLLFFLEYLIVRKSESPAWKKWSWASLLLIWIIVGNALRQLLTFGLFTIMGEKVFEQTPHFLLGCLFIVVTSLLIWFSSLFFNFDNKPQEKENRE